VTLESLGLFPKVSAKANGVIARDTAYASDANKTLFNFSPI
jgi:hypothetical protein